MTSTIKHPPTLAPQLVLVNGDSRSRGLESIDHPHRMEQDDHQQSPQILRLDSPVLEPQRREHHHPIRARLLRTSLGLVLSNPLIHKDIDAIIAMGVLIKGDTMHFEYISDAVSKKLMDVSIQHNKPIIFGVLTCLTEQQALIRSGLDPMSPSNHNHAIDWAKAAVDCALTSRRLSSSSQDLPHFITAKDL
ncbi:hypothetical protein PSTT_01821 [Puccinia striiformis]|uniref:6,7-dimethyl-8-ribityllumazine synthase n=1 Tax=Puccinia striiformis TaxID=27350 RepID=A0A2S4W2C5_9BASI|nr:hypothetical protein PSTT_01821 [Puccinia striiformis]